MTQHVQTFSIEDQHGDQSSLESRFDLAANYLSVRANLGLDKMATALPAHTADLDRYGDAELRNKADENPSFEEPGDSVILTKKGSQNSAVFLPHAIPAGQSFKATAKIMFRGTADCGFADGCALVLSSAKGVAPQGGGSGLGFTGLGSAEDVAIAVKTWRQDGLDQLGNSAGPPAPCITLQSPLHASHDHCIAYTPPGSIPWLSRVYTAPFTPDGPLHTRYPFHIEMFYNATKRTITGTLLYQDPDKKDKRPRRYFLFEKEVPASDAPERFVGVTASTGDCEQATDLWDLKVELVTLQ